MGRPAATVLTEGFAKSAELRSKILGMPSHPKVFVDHPLASKTVEQVQDMAERFVDEIARALTLMPEAA
ncbi:MAG: hypothetical protein CMM55_15355 [Rhodospirillaceae bacterium]|nr:hypothetical protein [Rhodospirillaceae bacterium]